MNKLFTKEMIKNYLTIPSMDFGKAHYDDTLRFQSNLITLFIDYFIINHLSDYPKI